MMQFEPTHGADYGAYPPLMSNEPPSAEARPLSVLRAMLDALDTDVMQLLSRRMSIVAEVAGYKVRVPMLDVVTLGAGGGSIAWLDAAGGVLAATDLPGLMSGVANGVGGVTNRA